jgi:iron complex outermembrane recepter protein
VKPPLSAPQYRRLPLAVFAALPLFLNAPARAQTSPPEDPVQLERFEVAEKGVSRANNVLKFSDLAPTSAAGTNALNSLSRLPGVNSTSSTNYGLRNGDGSGLRLRAFTISVLGVAVDGIPSATTNGFQSNPPTRFFDTENVSNVEVSPGTGDVATPSFSALGGSINYFTRGPKREAGAEISGTFGSRELRRVFFRADSGEVAAGLSAFVSGSNTSQLVNFSDSDKPVLRRWKYDTQIHYATPLVSATASIGYYRANDHDDRPISGSNYGNWVPYSPGSSITGDLSDRGRRWFYPTIDDGNPNGLESVNYDKNRNNRTELLYSLRVEVTPNANLKFTAIPYYQDREGASYGAVPYNTARTFFENAIKAQPGRTDIVAPLGYPTALLGSPNALPAGVTSLASQDSASDNKPNAREAAVRGHRRGLPLSLTWKAGSHTVEAGAWFEQEKSESIRKLRNVVGGVITAPFDFSGFITTYFDQRTALSTQQFYAKDTVRFFDNRLALSAGAKSLKVQTDFEGIPDNTYFDRAIRVHRTPTYSDRFIPQAGATFQLTPANEIFANYSENFSSPSTGIVGGSKFVQDELQAERANNIDVGLRSTHRKWSASLAGYAIKYKNRIGDVTNFDPLLFGSANTATAYTNVGSVNGYGTELALSAAPVRNLRANFSAAWQSLKYEDNYSENSSSGALVVREIRDHTVPNTPKWSANSDVTYTLGGFFVGVNAKFSDRVFLTTANNQVIPSYTLFGAGIGYEGARDPKARLSHLRVALNVENLFDRYWFYATGAATAFSNGSFNVGTPRALYLTVAGKF